MATQQQQNISNEDPAVNKVYASSYADIPVTTGNTAIYITNLTEYTNIRVSGPAEPAGNTTEVQFNTDGRMDGDDGLTYNPTTDSLTVLGNLTSGAVFTNVLKYANGTTWSLSTYGNSNVATYLPTYVGNLNPNVVSATLFAGSGANLTNIPAGNVVGTVPSATSATSATTATTAATVTSAAQPNITSLGTLLSLTVSNKVTAGQLQGDGGNIGNIQASNISGTIALATRSTVADTANTVAGANVTGTVANATNSTNATFAGTVTTNAQPNITSVGSLTGLVVSNATGVVNFTTTANVSLGEIGNLHITGGTASQVLTTNGSGGLSWTTPTTGTLQDVTTNGATTNQAVSITNTTESSGYSTGALTVTGGLGVGKEIHANEHITARTSLYAGALSDFSSWTIPKFIGRDAGAAYIQGALINTSNTGSADWVAYGDQSTDSNGWMDMGFTGTGFNDANYTITKESDGYIICQGMPTQGGNLVIATGQQGGSTHRDIVFATGGFLIENEKMRLNHEDSTFYVGAHGEAGGTNVVNLDVNGNVTIGGNLSFSNSIHTMISYGANNYINMNNDGGVDLSANTEIKITTNYGDSMNRKYSYFYANGTFSTGNISATNITFPDSSTISSAPKNEPKFALEYGTFTSVIGQRYLVDSLGAVASTTLPTSPSTGDAIYFTDAFGSFNTNNFTVNKSDKNIMGGSSYVASTNGQSFGLVYNGSEWRTYS